MLIRTPRPQGSSYPQLTQAPITSYTDFLNFFRGGHTIDNNLDSRQTQATVQFNMLTTALASGHLMKQGNPFTGKDGAFIVDIFPTDKGAASIPRENVYLNYFGMALEFSQVR